MFEKVNPCHPDKVADRIAGAIVDLAYKSEENPKIAVEVLVGHGACHVIIETTEALSKSDIAKAVNRIAGNVLVDINIAEQDKHLAKNQADGVRCGDNGIFKGVPLTDEQKKLSEIARDIYAKYPYDGKYILNDNRLIICQSNAATDDLCLDYPTAEINPIGDWTGGTDVDTGATNRKLGSDTSFSASLIASLNGDTEAAANKANQAIVDMADNANKMGTDMSMIQSAYQGFAKQNYTMLDNLKLGYGGTKTEMERLLADASEIAGVEFSIDSYADIVDAIHIIQTQMGITGTTAKEAEYTITGSISSLKSALQNLITGFGNSEADIQGLCDNVVEGFQTVVKNITPIIGNIISALPTAVDALIEAVGDLLPTFLTMVTDLFSQVLETLLNLLPSLVPAAMDALLTIVNTLIKNLPLIINVAAKIITSLASGIAKSLPQLIPTIVQAVIEVCETLIANLPLLLHTVLQIIEGLVEGILYAIPIIIDALPEIILAIIDFILEAIPQIIETGIKLFTSLRFRVVVPLMPSST